MITITIITKNEERNLRRLLPSLVENASRSEGLVSEILVLDSGSTDASESVARAHGAVWHSHSWEGYGPQKRRASQLARNAWILNLDADEVPDLSFWEGLRQFFAERKHECFRAATLERDFVLFKRRLRFGGASEQRRVRLYEKSFFEWNEAAVHEDVVALPGRGTRVGALSGHVLHYSWESTSAFLKSTDERAGVLARQRLELEGQNSPFGARVVFRFWFEFVRSYFLRLGILDGVPGFVFCFFMAFAQALKFVKAYELQVGSDASEAP
ncbi:MAG: glycosyltransferase family 2 protein [Silvanigrellales bacterium]|nr:glycosyltransferase family 2 protein [Silvanigrellales bacterium]